MHLSPRFCTDFPMSSPTLQLTLSLSCATADGVWLPDLWFQALLSVPRASAWLHVTSDHSVATKWHNSGDVTVAADGVMNLSVYIAAPGPVAVYVAVYQLSAYSSPVVVPPPGWSFVPDALSSSPGETSVSGRLSGPAVNGPTSSNLYVRMH